MARSKSPGAVLYMDQVLAELANQAPDAVLRGEAAAVHRARVATRRMGAAMQVMHPLAEAQQWRILAKALKRIRRSVQTLRDIDVMQEHLADFAQAGVYTQACELVRGQLGEERVKTHEQVVQDADLEKWLGQTGYWMVVRGSLSPRDEEIRGLIRQSLRSQFAEFSSQADRLAEALLAGDGQHDVQPHALRIAGKFLRYTFEMAQAEHMGAMARTLKRFKQLQDALGVWHDYLVLSARVMQVCEGQLNQGQWQVEQRDLILLAAHVHRESARCLKQFAKLWRKHRAFLLHQLAVATSASAGETATAPVSAPAPLTVPQNPEVEVSHGNPDGQPA